ncbi:MAG: DUF1700 domain-containing protein [Defluviitaleaceae bacterium]|nr:DUF1700 domain-containing protein [Defluviitaleaceae bacterium]
MTAVEYLEQLSWKLRVLPESERRDALEYYEGYLSDAEDEAAAIIQLGSPGEVAANILANHVLTLAPPSQANNLIGGVIAKEPVNQSQVMPAEDMAKPSVFSGMKTTWVIILAIFAMPVGLPIIIAVAAIAFGLFITLAVLVFSFVVAGLAMLLAGFVSIFVFPFIIFQGFGFSMIMMGTGLITIGLGIFFVKFSILLMRGFPKISRYVGKEIRRVGNGKQ